MVIIGLCLHWGDVRNVISEWGVFTGTQGACCTDCCTVCQPRIRGINGESTDESFRFSGSGIVVLRDMKVSGVEVGLEPGRTNAPWRQKGSRHIPEAEGRPLEGHATTERMGGGEGRIYGSVGGEY